MSVSNKQRFEQLIKTLKTQKIEYTVNFYESYYTVKETVIRRRKNLCSYLFDGYSGNRFDAGNLRYSDRFWILENYGLSAMQTFEEETITETKNIELQNILVLEFNDSIYTIQKDWIDEPAAIGSLIEIKPHVKCTDIFSVPFLDCYKIYENYSNNLCINTEICCSAFGLQDLPAEKTKLFLNLVNFELSYYTAKHNLVVTQKNDYSCKDLGKHSQIKDLEITNKVHKRIEFFNSLQKSEKCFFIDSDKLKTILSFKDGYIISIENKKLVLLDSEKNHLFTCSVNIDQKVKVNFSPKLLQIILQKIKGFKKGLSFYFDSVKNVIFMPNLFYLACMQKLD